MMESPDKDVLKGMLLDQWMEDLLEDRAPRIVPEMEQLSQHDIAETLALSRWLATMTPAVPTSGEVESVASTVRARIRREEEDEQQALADAAKEATSFGGFLITASRVRHLRWAELERMLRLPSGTLDRLAQGELPPHRIAVDRMVALLHALRVPATEVVELVRSTGFEWVSRVYAQPATQLGRINAQLGAESRYALLAESEAVGDHRAELLEELDRINRYCDALSA